MNAPLIMISDDDQDLRRILVDLLTAEGYRTCEAWDGEVTLELVAKHNPDLLILDLSMPNMDGREVCKRLRASDAFSTLPIIAFTANAIGNVEEQVRAAGCNCYVAKPFAVDDLLARIKSLLAPQAKPI
jgi:CheY-like chemotaxis protein